MKRACWMQVKVQTEPVDFSSSHPPSFGSPRGFEPTAGGMGGFPRPPTSPTHDSLARYRPANGESIHCKKRLATFSSPEGMRVW